MRTAEFNNGDVPLATLDSGPMDDNYYPDVTPAANKLIDIANTWTRELLAFPGDGDVVISKRGNAMSITAPDRGTISAPQDAAE